MTPSGRLLVFMGMKHCGKSTLGRMFAEHLKLPFTDLDAVANEIAYRKYGINITVREVYRNEGKEAFQALEKYALLQIIAGYPAADQCAVVAIGGGTIENSEGMAALDAKGYFIYLYQDEAVLFKRITASGIPPFLEGPDPQEAFHVLYENRTALYREKADIEVDIRNLSPEQGVKKILNRTGYYGS